VAPALGKNLDAAPAALIPSLALTLQCRYIKPTVKKQMLTYELGQFFSLKLNGKRSC
jgi:hypothetical protein